MNKPITDCWDFCSDVGTYFTGIYSYFTGYKLLRPLEPTCDQETVTDNQELPDHLQRRHVYSLSSSFLQSFYGLRFLYRSSNNLVI